MKKPKGVTKPKPPAKAREREPEVDPAVIEELRELLANLGDLEDGFGDDDPVELFRDYLDLCGAEYDSLDEKEDLYNDLLGSLVTLQIDFEHGEAHARQAFEEIEEALAEAIEDEDVGAVDLLMIAKMFAEAKFDPPARLKSALAEAIAKEPSGDGEGGDPRPSLLDLARAVGDDPFEMYEQLSALIAGFPLEYAEQLVDSFVVEPEPLTLHAVAGFLLHREPRLAAAAAQALIAAAAKTPIESLLVERLVRMRPWVGADRQPALDATIKALRSNAGAPVKAAQPKIGALRLSICDGAGGRSLAAMAKAGRKHIFATILMTSKGVADVFVEFDASKDECESLVAQTNAAILTEAADAATATRMIRLSLADNLKTGAPPTYKLVQIAEILGLGPLPPDETSPEAIAAELIEGAPTELTNEAAAKRAQNALANELFSPSWFEDSKQAREALRPRRGFSERIKALMKDVLPARRGFWARQCALSALALRGTDLGHPPADCIAFALAARDFASDKPLDKMALMRAIAEQSARAFKARTAGGL